MPLQARADYRSIFQSCFRVKDVTFIIFPGLTEDSMEWQMNNAVSAVAKGGYRPGNRFLFLFCHC